MAVRIKEVEVHSSGPVASFKEEFAPLTLVYAKNERGKTTIAENIIASLFRDRKDGMFPALRGSEFISNSRVTVHGLSKRAEVFSPGNRRKRLEDFFTLDSGSLPGSLFNLLCVRGAETAITAGSSGLTRNALKSLVSRQQVYETVKKNIPSETGYTEFTDGFLQAGKRIGKYKDFEENLKKLKFLLNMSDRFHYDLAQTRLIQLKREREALEQRKRDILYARRHRAWLLNSSIEKLDDLGARFDTGGIDALISSIRDFETRDRDRIELEKARAGFGNVEEDARWIEGAQELYAGCLQQARNIPQTISLACAIASTVAAGALFFLKPVLAPVFLVVSLLSLLMSLVFSRIVSQGKTPESARIIIEQVKEDFSGRFSRDLQSPADFDAVRRELEQKRGEMRGILEQLKKNRAICSGLETEIQRRFIQYGLEGVDTAKWLESASALREKARKHEIQRTSAQGELRNLGVDPSDYMEKPASIEYSREMEEETAGLIARVDEEMEKENGSMRSIYETLSNPLGTVAFSGNIEAISEALGGSIVEHREQMLDALARMLAGHAVNAVVADFQQHDDEQLEEFLNDPKIAGLVERYTGRYDRLFLEGEDIYAGIEGESYDLGDMSSGAREQILLALRIGIAEKLTGEENLFLILDDAFQYSDWERRQGLVAHARDLVLGGWQVIYFTMDDDIRDRFVSAGRDLGKEQFRLIELA